MRYQINITPSGMVSTDYDGMGRNLLIRGEIVSPDHADIYIMNVF